MSCTCTKEDAPEGHTWTAPDCLIHGVEATQDRCTQYSPDIQAQGDCRNCGWGWEHHQ